MDWREFVETLSKVDQTLRLDPADVYSRMDFATRDSYRHAVERIARHSDADEAAVASAALQMASEAAARPQCELHRTHVGYYLDRCGAGGTGARGGDARAAGASAAPHRRASPARLVRRRDRLRPRCC